MYSFQNAKIVLFNELETLTKRLFSTGECECERLLVIGYWLLVIGYWLKEAELEFAVEFSAQEKEEQGIECDGTYGDEGADWLGKTREVTGGKDTDEQHGRQDVGEEHGEESTGGADSDGDRVTHIVGVAIRECRNGHIDVGFLLFGELTARMGCTGGTATQAKDADPKSAFLHGGDDTLVCCDGFHIQFLQLLGAFLQFFTQRPLRSILCGWPW